MAAFASSSVKNTEDRNEVWKCLLYMFTGRSEVSKRILNTLFWLTSLCVQQGPHPTWYRDRAGTDTTQLSGHKTLTWSIFISTPHYEIILFGATELNSYCLVHISLSYN